MTKLYEIAETYRDAAQALENTDLDPQTVADTLEGLSGDLQLKSTNVAMVVRNLEATVEAIDAAIKQMQHRRQVIQNRADNIREYLKSCMETAGITKIECPYFRLVIRDNPESVAIDAVADLPPEYFRIPDPPPPEPDKKKIKEALRAGKEVPGARLVRGKRLEIK